MTAAEALELSRLERCVSDGSRQLQWRLHIRRLLRQMPIPLASRSYDNKSTQEAIQHKRSGRLQ